MGLGRSAGSGLGLRLVGSKGSNLLARAVQHETDHLDGILFIDRLDPEMRKEAMRQIREAEWFGQPAPAVHFSPHAISSRWL